MNGQTVRASVNKGIFIGFEVTTAAATSTDVITAAVIAAAGGSSIREIYVKCTLDDGYLGLGGAASVVSTGAANATEGVVIAIKDAIMRIENCNCASLDIIRAASTNVKVVGYVVVN